MSEKGPKPSEWAELRRKNQEARAKEIELQQREAAKVEAMPVITEIMKWFGDPPELKAYLSYFPNNEEIDKAINLMFAEEPYKTLLAAKENRDAWMILNKYRLDSLESFVQSLEEQEKREQEKETKKVIKPKSGEPTKQSEVFPPDVRERIIKAAVRVCERKDKVHSVDIYTELRMSKKTFFAQLKIFGLSMALLLDEAEEIIRKKEK